VGAIAFRAESDVYIGRRLYGSSMKTDALIDVGLHHLARFAFFTRDNPFLSSRAAVRLPARHRSILRQLLDGELDCDTWLSSPSARPLLQEIRVGCVPRNVQLVTKEGQPKAGVVDVHAFLQAPLFWWLASILWCLTAGRTLDPLLDDEIMGYRLHPGFVEEPAQRGLMFRDYKTAHKSWRRFASTISKEFPGEVLATNAIDLRDFYYSATAPPSTIVSRFLKAKGKRWRRGQRAHTLTQLLDVMHARYTARCREIKPRSFLTEASSPLPVGLPSSRIMANFIVDLARGDLVSLPHIEGVAAYADDLLLMTRELPGMTESTAAYLSRLELIPVDSEPTLSSPAASAVADLVVGLEKSSTSYSRSSEADEEGPDDEQTVREDPNLDPYIESHPDPDWGGRLRTVLQAPHRPERIPRELVKELEQMVDEVRIGLDPVEVESRLKAFIEEVDSGLFLALRPHWVDLLVVGILAGGAEFVEKVSTHYIHLVDDLEPPGDATQAMRQALRVGLRASWIQALAQALAVALGEADLDLLEESHPMLFEETSIGSVKMEDVVSYAKRLRKRRLIPGSLVSTPLAEFTSWKGALVGHEAFTSFNKWAYELSPAERREELLAGLPDSVRFVQLHEICIALHLWVNGPEEEGDWLSDAFSLLRQQPLVQHDQVKDLWARASACIEPAARDATALDGIPSLRFALPSVPIEETQLEALLKGDATSLGAIASRARRRIRSIVGISTRNKADVLVLPEWSLPPQQLPWLMKRAADKKMLVIAGETPAVARGEYRNRIWTGIPIQDSATHRECLVVPPREKRYLSAAEIELIDAAEVTHANTNASVPVYDWRGIRFASLVCFEFADIATRMQLQAGADLLTVSSFNKDWRYFDAIQESTTRDNYCLTVCVNTGTFPGTKIMRPTSSAMSVAASVHGSEDPAVVSRKIDMLPVVAARIQGRKPSEATKTAPTDDTTLDDYRAYRPI
jgi:predicted amidohydrolase